MHSYTEFLHYLDVLGERRIRPGLTRMLEACARLGHPERACPAVHIAGTNGKGSTAAMLAALLTQPGQRVGLFTSPHLCNLRERIRIDGQMISEADMLRHAVLVREHCGDLDLSYFECITVIAFLAFAEAGLTLAIYETGLGGRLDATNVLQPLVSVLTPIAHDHAHWLGDTLAAIAAEKCGIIKESVPVVTAPQAAEAEAVIERTCAERNAKLEHAQFWPRPIKQLPGAHQQINAGVAYATARLLREQGMQVADSFADLSLAWPGRCETLGPICFDAAHNPAGLERFIATVSQLAAGKPIRCAFTCAGDKDLAAMLRLLHDAHIELVVLQDTDTRLVSANELATQAMACGFAHARTMTVAEYCALAQQDPNYFHIMTGSFQLYQPLKHVLATTV